MKNILKFVLVLFPVMAIGQTQTENYIKNVIYKVPTQIKITTPTITQAVQNITYFDGLGRPIQQIANKQSASGKDIITHIKYDGFGRQVEEYLPFKSSNTNIAFDPLAETNVLSYYASPTLAATGNPAMEATTNPFSKKEIEASPLNRVLKKAAPGNDWKLGLGHEIKMNYQSNVTNEVKLFVANTIWDSSGLYTISFSDNGYYNAGELYKTITYDENTAATPSETNGSTIEFKNKGGQVILKRNYSTVGLGTTNEKYDTYYIYDIYGNLTYVIPPKASDLIGTSQGLQANLTSTTTVTSAIGPLNLTASNSIRLLPGFQALAGSTFSAVIDNGNQIILDNLCYQYRYDHRNRLVEKKLPGKQWEYIVYDKLDRVVATGPASSPFSDLTNVGWVITKYDTFNRPVYTGWSTTTPATPAGRTALQATQNSPSLTVINESKQTTGNLDNIPAYYTNVVEPTSFKLLAVNYYDNYTFPSTPTITIPTSVEGQTTLITTQVKGLSTASWTRVLTISTATLGETNVTFYDPKVRPIRNYTTNYLGGYTYTDSKLDDFSGQLQYSITRHKRLFTDTELTTKDTFTYSPQDRLLTQTHQINGGAVELIASNTYDELGQLISKKVGNTVATPTQNINYSYNIRGWLKDINNLNALSQSGDPIDLFAFHINYNTTITGITDVKPLYNGNISETQWATNSDGGIIRSYGYKYDNINRLKESIFKKATIQTNAYNEILNYDKNGNIQGLTRNGSNESATQIDNLVYNYADNNKTNQLTKVSDSAPSPANTNGFRDYNPNNVGDDYSYDANGNITKDVNKNITTIAYNHLNLPTKISFASGENIVYIYNAVGQKMQKIMYSKTAGQNDIRTTDYLGEFQYESLISPVQGSFASKLLFFPTVEGYVEPVAGSYKYVYQYKDHLGDVRLSYDKNLIIQEENNYYAFGLKQYGYNNINNSSNAGLKYKYNGKEFQDEMGINLYDYGWRNYDPALGRWMSIDNMSEKYLSTSPYHYAGNNPVVYLDIDGNEFTPIAEEWIRRIISNINTRRTSNNQAIEKANQRIASGRFGWFQSEKSLNKKIERLKNENTELTTTTNEIETLRDSDQVYDVVSDSNGTERDQIGNSSTINQTTYNSDNNRVQLTISSGTDLGLFSHELKHMYQFETGQTTLGLTKNKGSLTLSDNNLLFYDLSDEVEAYKRGALFGQRENINSVKDVLAKGVYSDRIPSGPFNSINHPQAAGIRSDPQTFANKHNGAFRIGLTTYKPQ
jgi:RHS repeat-associated protein